VRARLSRARRVACQLQGTGTLALTGPTGRD
jgi:hypothetical protein